MKKRGSFSGKLGYVLAAAGSAVGLGNIWRFPYLAAEYGGGIFLIIYIILALTFGYTMIVAETAMGRYTGKSSVVAFLHFGKKPVNYVGGFINLIIPLLIVPYYSVIGGWVCKYLVEYIRGSKNALASDDYFGGFISNGVQSEVYFIIFALMALIVIAMGVRSGVERVSKFMMPVLVVLSVIIAIYSMTRPGAIAGVAYFLIPNPTNFKWQTVVSAMQQMFYSLSIAMGILITYGSYMHKDVSIDESTRQLEVFDTAIAMMAGLMIIPAVFAFSNGDPGMLKSGPSLMFITMPKIFASMGIGTPMGILFFVLVLFAALTSAISLLEAVVSTLEDVWHWKRLVATIITGIVMLLLGSLSALGYGPLSGVTIIGKQFLDFFDFITNNLMMPVSALITCYVVVKYWKVSELAKEVTVDGASFGRRKIFDVMIRYIAPVFLVVILVSGVLAAFGVITI